MSKIIIFNGPPNCGKDEATSYYKRQFGTHNFSFKTELFALAQKLFCVTPAQWASWYTREGKELPREELGGRSARQALIHVSEDIVKPFFGSDWFGQVEAHKLAQIAADGPLVAACSDGGFNSEVIPLVEKFGADNVHIVRIHRDGCSYKGDSRSWIDTPVVPEVNYWDVHNNAELQDYWTDLSRLYHIMVSE